jgi:hypothetical protein
MAKTFEILDKVLYSENCPMGVEDVYEQEYFEKHPAATGDEDEFEDNKPPSIYKMEEEQQLKWAYKVLKANNAKPNHGDVIWIGGSDNYRNEGIHFWDAKNEKIVPMETKIADYGHVPKMFAVGKGEGEFSSRHWDGISYYNNLEPVWSSRKNKWYCPSNDEYMSDTDSE